jgi:sterol desaturase/sphingolipid hydroxylase (fatty acid hydroxylase superfamily)
MADILPLILLGIYIAFAIAEVVRPGRALPQVKRWRLKGTLFFVLFFGLSGGLPLLWDGWLGQHRVLDLTALGTLPGALVGLVGLQLVSYAWHRSLHRMPFLFRWFHQMHHSAERVDVVGAAYFHPLDMVGFAFVGSLSLVMLFGVTPEAAMIANVVAFFCSIFQHSNLKTPRWVGYLVQRPENHSIHHQRGVHGYNYGDISLWDIVFGTFKNPEGFPAEAGYYDGASAEVGAMLRGRDIAGTSAPASPPEVWVAG